MCRFYVLLKLNSGSHEREARSREHYMNNEPCGYKLLNFLGVKKTGLFVKVVLLTTLYV